jgi:hypothetical protein
MTGSAKQSSFERQEKESWIASSQVLLAMTWVEGSSDPSELAPTEPWLACRAQFGLGATAFAGFASNRWIAIFRRAGG